MNLISSLSRMFLGLFACRIFGGSIIRLNKCSWGVSAHWLSRRGGVSRLMSRASDNGVRRITRSHNDLILDLILSFRILAARGPFLASRSIDLPKT